MVCVKCHNVIDIPGAKFCVVCGWPLEQPCPYLCGADVLLRAGLKATPRCRSCGRPFAACLACGRLHKATELVCANEGQRLVQTSDVWSGVAGDNSGAAWARLQAIGTAPPVTGPVLPEGGFSGLACTNGILYYAHGSSVRSMRPGGANGVVGDLGQPDLGTWSLIASGHSVYFAAGHRLSIIEVGAESVSSIEGRVLAQTCSDAGWFGVSQAPSGEVRFHAEPGGDCPLPFPSNSLAGVYTSDGWIVVAERNGRAWRYRNLELEPINEPWSNLQLAWVYGSRLYLLGNDCLQSLEPDSGRLVHQWNLGPTPITCAPAVSDDACYLFVGDGEYRVLGLNGTVEGTHSHNFGFVSQACGLTINNTRAMMVVGRGSADKRVGAFNLEGGAVLRVYYTAPPNAPVNFAIADDRVYVASAEPHSTRVRAYEVA